MVEREAALDRTFAALGDATRRALLVRLRRGPATVGALAAPFPVSLAAISKHVRVLERAGLLRREIVGREHVLALQAAPLRRATEWTDGYRAFWESRLDALEAYLQARPRRTRRRRREEQR